MAALYVFPVIVAATVLSRRDIVLIAMACGVMRVAFGPAPSFIELALGFAMASLAYTGAGLFVAELVRNRQLAISHLQQIRCQQLLRREAEEQLRVLADSSPAAIMTIDASGRILGANRAAHDLLAFSDGNSLAGENIAPYLPVLADALKLDIAEQEFRTAAQCRGKRRNGDVFIANTWFSTYMTAEGRRLAAIAVDSSEEMRDREEQNLHQLLHANRIVAAAVSHDVRNLCGAITVVYSNLKRLECLQASEDFRALGGLVQGLAEIASIELRSRTKDTISNVDLVAILEQLRIIIEPSWEEIDGKIEWFLPNEPVPVLGDQTGLLQAFLNLAYNSHRAVQRGTERRLEIDVRRCFETVTTRFRDSGPGVDSPEQLFQPFQPGAESTGIGLYVSRAILRSYGGELRYEPTPSGCSFVAEIEAAQRAGMASS